MHPASMFPWQVLTGAFLLRTKLSFLPFHQLFYAYTHFIHFTYNIHRKDDQLLLIELAQNI